jgi:hypothetical protein
VSLNIHFHRVLSIKNKDPQGPYICERGTQYHLKIIHPLLFDSKKIHESLKKDPWIIIYSSRSTLGRLFHVQLPESIGLSQISHPGGSAAPEGVF